MKLQNRTILITGGTSGIGKELALQLRANNRVIVTGVRKTKIEAASNSGLTALPLNLSDKNSIEELVLKIEQDFPSLDVLINNAGIQFNYDFIDDTDPGIKVEKELNTNLIGTIQLTQLLIPILATKPSLMINVTSALGSVPKSNGLLYSVSKAGLRNFHRGLKKIMKGQSLKLIELIPPVTDTEMTAGREETKMPADVLAVLAIKQIEKGKKLVAPFKIRLFLMINRLFPHVADRIIG